MFSIQIIVLINVTEYHKFYTGSAFNSFLFNDAFNRVDYTASGNRMIGK
jgi:hypothetical protein